MTKGLDRRRRHLKDFLKVGRIGKKYKLFGAPAGVEDVFDSPQEAEAAYNSVVNNFKDYEVVNRKIVKKESKDG